MKKIFSTLAAIAIVATMVLSVYATGLGGSESVTATYEYGTADVVYSVDISWQGMSFTYLGADESVWDPVNHVYGPKAEGSWAQSNASITVTNHSNAAIYATFIYEKDSGFGTADMVFDTEGFVVPSAETNARAESDSIKVKPSGFLTETATGGTKIGTITVSIEPAVDICGKTVDEAAEAVINYIEGKNGTTPIKLPLVTSATPTVEELSGLSDAIYAQYKTSTQVELYLDGVVTIPDANTECSAFYGQKMNHWISSIVLPDAITIGSWGFGYCYKLVSIDAPKVTTLKENILFEATAIENVRFGSALISVSAEAFENNESLGNVTLYLSADQKVMEKGASGTWIPTAESYWNSDDYENNKFCGYTFKDVVVYTAD